MDASVIAALIGAGGAGTIAVVSNVIISRISGARTEGVITESLKNVSERMDRQDKSQQLQWQKIDDHEGRIGFLEGKTNGRAQAHRAST